MSEMNVAASSVGGRPSRQILAVLIAGAVVLAASAVLVLDTQTTCGLCLLPPPQLDIRVIFTSRPHHVDFVLANPFQHPVPNETVTHVGVGWPEWGNASVSTNTPVPAGTMVVLTVNFTQVTFKPGVLYWFTVIDSVGKYGVPGTP